MRADRFYCDECGVCAEPCSACPPDLFAHDAPLTPEQERAIEMALPELAKWDRLHREDTTWT